MLKLKELAENLKKETDDLVKFKEDKEIKERKIKKLSEEEKTKLLGKSEKEWLDSYFIEVGKKLEKLGDLTEGVTERITKGVEIKKEGLPIIVPIKKPKEERVTPSSHPEKEEIKEVKPTPYKGWDKRLRKQYLKDLNIDEDLLEDFTKAPKKEIKVTTKEQKYTIYTSTSYSRLSNYFMEGLSKYIIKRYPKFFDRLYTSLKTSGLRFLSRTYISIILFTSFLVSFLTFFSVVGLSYAAKVDILQAMIRGVSIAFLVFAATFVIAYYYPTTVANSKRRKIKNDLPFVIIHMSAVAGSGAQPISMFNLVLSSGEYKGLEGEIKKIVNYVNLYGYDLSTALREVAKTTPSPEFKDLCTGITATIEAGGNLKAYLKEKADEAVNTYKLERKKYVESLSTYSDIYTGILIAAPLLFMVTLAVINLMGGKIGPFTVKTLSIVGVYAVIPLLNVAFLLFLSVIQPE